MAELDFVPRTEYKDDLGAIHKRIDQIFDVLRRNGNKPQDYKTVALFATVIFSLGSVMQMQINISRDYENRIRDLVKVNNSETHTYLARYVEMQSDEIIRVRAWKDKMEQSIPVIETDVKWLQKYIETKAKDRYTRTEANKDLQHIKELITVTKGQ